MERSIPAIIIMVSIMLTIVGGGLFYVGRKIFKCLCIILPNVNPRFFMIIPAIIVLSFALSFLPLDVIIKKYLVWFNWFFMGLVLYLGLFFALSDLILFIGRLTGIVPSPTPPAVTLAAGVIVMALVAGLSAYGVYNGRQIKSVSYTVEIEKETALKNLNIVLIADTHLGYQNDEKWLEKIVQKINAAEPDIVVIAGDIFNDNYRALTNPREAARLLKSIKSKYGVFAVLGNHDGGATYEEMLAFLKEGNVALLLDEYAVIEDKFVVVGRCDAQPIGRGAPPRKDTAEVLAGIDESLPVIVIEHHIESIDEYEGRADLMFAGHTHKGQMFPGNIITGRMYEVDYGYYRRNAGSPHIVVTSGAGVWGPSERIGTNNEVVSVLAEFK